MKITGKRVSRGCPEMPSANAKTPAGRIKDRIRTLVAKLAGELEREYRPGCGDVIDPHVLALNETRNFVMELYRGAKLLWEAAVLAPRSVEAVARMERTRQAMKCLRCGKCKKGSK